MSMHRRHFLAGSLAGLGLLTSGRILGEEVKKPRLRKAVKYGMIQIQGGSIEDRFNLIKKVGFQGVEMDSPSSVNKEEAVKAAKATGIRIHGVVDSIHWNVRLSDPDEKVRARGLAGLETALKDAAFYGADTVLLVPGAVRDPQKENYQQVWDRSTEQVKKVIPTAEKLKVKIAIEVVWNNFITKPDELIKYVDQFKSPWVGAYFDCSNMLRYGVKSSEWIRKLGKRMLKFDFKGFSKEKFDRGQNPWVAIGEGSEDWPEIIKALGEIGYDGWATAEVGGGGEKVLRDISERMDRVLGLK